jgi:protein TonB
LEYKQVPKVEPKPVEKTPEIQPEKSSHSVKKIEGELSGKKLSLDPPPIKVQKSPKKLPKPKQQRKKVTRPKQERDRLLHPRKEKPAEVVPKSVPAPKPDHRPKATQSAQADEIYEALAVPEQDFIQREETTAKPNEHIASVAPVRILREAKPLYRKNPPPKYPRLARKRGYEGTVILEVLVDTRGRVGDLRVLESSGYKVLDRAASKSVKDWLFEPGKRGEEKVEMWVKIPLRFQIE